ncbi:recombinase family protein [Streptomyces sp. NPDC058623]|uniref:recombinase family protein n=1 Tax=Streptomyces sp. NPDC058623 TaxID=3346563 RepID=UPI0036552D32
MLEAAAVALHLAGTGAITTRGSLGHLVMPPQHPEVYDGDPPPPAKTGQDEAWEAVARYFATREQKEPGRVAGILALFTQDSRTLEDFDLRWQYLIDIGFSPSALPDARGLGRHDLLPASETGPSIRVRPQFEAALPAAREIKAHAPPCRVIFTVYEMKRLGRDAAELTALADHLTAHGLVLEMLAGPLPGMYDPSGPGRLLFAFFAAMAETERENIRESTLEGLDTAARKGKHAHLSGAASQRLRDSP